MLRLAVLSGVSREFAVPWLRVAPGDPVPLADAVAQRRLVWIGGQEEMARRYPRPGLILPYRFALAAMPVTDSAPGDSVADSAPGDSAADSAPGDPVADSAPGDSAADSAPGDSAADSAPGDPAAHWGGLVLLWPGSHPPRLSPAQRDDIAEGCARLAAVCRREAEHGAPLRPGHQPRLVRRHRRTPGPIEATAAVEFVERLPGGSVSLDLNGVVTYLTEAAADLLGADVDDLLGALPWEALPWMDDPAVEDRYRAAVISRQTTSFTAVRPPGRRLRFDLHPGPTGISVRVTPAPPEDPADGPAEDPGEPALTGEAGPRPDDPDHTAHPPLPSRATALYQLMHLAATLTEAAGVQDVVDQAADQLVPALGAEALALLTAEENRLRVIAYRGAPYRADVRDESAPLTSEIPAARVLLTGDPLFFGTRAELAAAHPRAAVLKGQGDAWAFLPLIASGRPVGSLVLTYDRPRPFHPGERAILTALAGLIAQALDRARLYDSKQELAHRLQAGLLPHNLPRVPGAQIAARYLPAGRGVGIGGDFYDVIRLTGASMAATIGDVQGHNVEAAALMGQVRTAVHASAGAPPGEVLARTNRLLTDLDPGLFTSCLYAHIDLAHHRALLATAGHPPPLVRHPDGHTAPLDLPPGLLLGIDPTARYAAGGLTLPPGTVLALYTDGLVEQRGIGLDEATADLAGQLSLGSPDDLDALADALVGHARAAAPRHDDMALLLIRTTGPPAPPGPHPV
ncbi:SpoIIE family protein phosphatase [Streptomyces sp. ODS05-4]|uniref:SpoIIE family protein phosphatase n=1 Tax=Streptomyces sp. ODS05-4 TaxID=2944939 RepID=UPI00210AEA2D|nr:SpoIIE family protein phosphatase [Streptomyces sp. ODS05-4]